MNVSKVFVGALLVGALASCASPGSSPAPGTASPSASSSTASGGSFVPLKERSQDTPDAPATAKVTSITTEAGSGGSQKVTVTLDGGTGGWSAYETDQVKRGESDEPLPLSGDDFLVVNIAGVTIDDGEESAPTPVPDVSSRIVGIDYMPPFEGQAQLALGLQSASEYRVERLSDPSRIVVEVR